LLAAFPASRIIGGGQYLLLAAIPARRITGSVGGVFLPFVFILDREHIC